MDDSDLDSNYLSEDEYESSGNSSQHSAYSLQMRRDEMNLDDDDTNQQEPNDDEPGDDESDDEHQSNRTPSDV